MNAGKRLFDVTLVMLTAPVWLPLFCILYLFIALLLGRPAIFRQERPGLHGAVFTMYKFRTMAELCDENGKLLPDEQRLSRLGQLLRKSSLDELPELWNVLRGDMSLVGPRPLLKEYLPLYSERHAQRHAVVPGITGWAQINGRNALSWSEKFEFDVWYVKNRSFRLDLVILWKTFFRVLAAKDTQASGHSTMPAFKGYDD